MVFVEFVICVVVEGVECIVNMVVKDVVFNFFVGNLISLFVNVYMVIGGCVIIENDVVYILLEVRW